MFQNIIYLVMIFPITYFQEFSREAMLWEARSLISFHEKLLLLGLSQAEWRPDRSLKFSKGYFVTWQVVFEDARFSKEVIYQLALAARPTRRIRLPPELARRSKCRRMVASCAASCSASVAPRWCSFPASFLIAEGTRTSWDNSWNKFQWHEHWEHY